MSKTSPRIIVRCWTRLSSNVAIWRVRRFGRTGVSLHGENLPPAAAPTILLTRKVLLAHLIHQIYWLAIAQAGAECGEGLSRRRSYGLLAEWRGLNVLIKREVVGFRANTVENRS